MPAPKLYLAASMGQARQVDTGVHEAYAFVLRDFRTQAFLCKIYVDHQTFQSGGEVIEGWPNIKRLAV